MAALGAFLMSKYQLILRGEDFLIDLDGKEELLGFYQTIYLEEDGPQKAEHKAVDIIKESDLAGLAVAEKNEQARIFLDEIYEVESFEGIENLVQGRAFFPMSDLDKKW